MSKALPNAGKPGKRNNKGSDKNSNEGSKGGGSSKLDPRKVEAYHASCPICGNSLGSYLSTSDEVNAENLHQQRVHGHSAHKKTISDEAQRKRNQHGGR